MIYSHYVVRTAFHGGGIISRHRSRRAAEDALERGKRAHMQNLEGKCLCGYGFVVASDDYYDLPIACDASHPWAAARDR